MRYHGQSGLALYIKHVTLCRFSVSKNEILSNYIFPVDLKYLLTLDITSTSGKIVMFVWTICIHFVYCVLYVANSINMKPTYDYMDLLQKCQFPTGYIVIAVV